MKKILVPVDFSRNAENATLYATAFASKTGADLVLLHVYEVITTTGMYMSVEAYMKSGIAKEMLALAKEAEKKLGASRVSTKIVKGSFIEVATEMLHKDDFDLLIMGTEGANGLLESITGTHTSELIANAEKAVLVVPDHCSFKSIRNIVFAIDQHSISSEDTLQPLIAIAQSLEAMIRLYHVDTGEEKTAMDNSIDQVLDAVPHSFHYELNTRNILENIDQFVEEHDAELLCMIRRHRTFIEQLFHNSLTRKEILKGEYPLLILSEKV